MHKRFSFVSKILVFWEPVLVFCRDDIFAGTSHGSNISGNNIQPSAHKFSVPRSSGLWFGSGGNQTVTCASNDLSYFWQEVPRDPKFKGTRSSPLPAGDILFPGDLDLGVMGTRWQLMQTKFSPVLKMVCCTK